MSKAETFLDAFLSALRRAADYNRADQAPPAAVLWTDRDRQWESLLPRLRPELPLFTLGPYDPATRTGPAIYLRCMVARALPKADWPEDQTPILYLPGVSRQELRAVEDCPHLLQPLAELQYRGVLWTQKNGRDWTIEAFLRTTDGGLQIEVATDNATREAMQRALVRLADEPVAALRIETPLTADKLNTLLNPEPVRNLLLWMNDPIGQKTARSQAEWDAFRAICKDPFNFDPETDGEITAAELLGKQERIWKSVWNRFTESPRRYPAIPELLRRARPERKDDLFYHPSSWPQDNEAAEKALRERLIVLQDALPADARRAIRELEAAHGLRREWVWTELGQSPLACALLALVALAEATERPLGGGTPQEIADAYVKDGWKADAAFLDALAAAGTAEDVTAVKIAVESLYRAWLQASAEAFQQAVQHHPLPLLPLSGEVPAPRSGCCLLFADGLRFDVGQRLADALEAKGLTVVREWQFAALPGVTATAKPAASPVAPLLGPGPEFHATVTSDGAKVTAETLRRELAGCGYAILSEEETGTPTGAAWTEFGHLDTSGHTEGWKLALRVPEEVRELAQRIQVLLETGWTEVRVITDHGWLLLPGGLPKADLPEHLTETRKGRCARLKPSSTTGQQTVPWHWDKEVHIAVAPGISCYTAGKEYEHGGLSPQECVIPILTVRGALPTGPIATIAEVRWTRLRCRVQIAGAFSGLMIDLRTRAADLATSLAAAPKPVEATGQVSLVVPDDSRQGEAALVVLLGPEGQVLAQRATIVGEDT